MKLMEVLGLYPDRWMLKIILDSEGIVRLRVQFYANHWNWWGPMPYILGDGSTT